MTLQFGEVVLVKIEFHQAAGSKIRPAVVLLDTGDDDFVAAPITSQPRNSGHDLALADWRGAGLNVASYVRPHKLTVLSKGGVVRRLATISEGDLKQLANALCSLFCPDFGATRSSI